MSSKIRQAVGVAFAAVAFVVIAVGLVWLCVALYPDRLPRPSHPDFVDGIFDSRVVIWAARLLLVSAAGVLALGGLFIVVSTIVRMRNREWLRRAGPFEVSEAAVANLQEQLDLWRDAALRRDTQIERLQRRLAESEHLIETLRRSVR
jgi:hypothetical protein